MSPPWFQSIDPTHIFTQDLTSSKSIHHVHKSNPFALSVLTKSDLPLHNPTKDTPLMLPQICGYTNLPKASLVLTTATSVNWSTKCTNSGFLISSNSSHKQCGWQASCQHQRALNIATVISNTLTDYHTPGLLLSPLTFINWSNKFINFWLYQQHSYI